MVQLKKFDMTISDIEEYGICNGLYTDRAVHSSIAWKFGDVENINAWLRIRSWRYKKPKALALPSELMS